MTDSRIEHTLQAGAKQGLYDRWYAACCTADSVVWQFGSDPEESRFDLASLTKPLVTGLGWSQVFAEGIVGPEWEIGQRLPVAARKGRLQIWHLLAHWSGLIPFDHHAPHAASQAERWQWIEEHWSGWQKMPPGVQQCYSDLGYLVAGEILSEIRSRPLDAVWQQLLIRLGLPGDLPVQYPVSGEQLPHDPVARALGGICGHAGLWGTGPALVLVVQALLRSGAKEPSKWPGVWRVPAWAPASTYTLGFDTPTGNSSAGSVYPQDTIGHLAFSGCSFWLSPDNGRATVLLTNRADCLGDPGRLVVSTTEAAGMFAVRQQIHASGWDHG